MGPLPPGIARHSPSHHSIGAGSSGGGRQYLPLKLLGPVPLQDRTNRAGPAIVAATLAADLSLSHCLSSTTQPDSLRAVNASDPRRDVNLITHAHEGGFGIDSMLRPGPNAIAPLHPGMMRLNIMFDEAYTTTTKSLKKKLVESESSLSTLQVKYDQLNAAKELSDTDYAAFSERQYDAGRKHEQIDRASRERNKVDAEILDNMHRDAQQIIDQNSLLDHELGVALKTNAALRKEYAEAHATYSERSYEAERKHELAVDVSCKRASIAAQVVDSMHQDAQLHMDESGLLEYDLRHELRVALDVSDAKTTKYAETHAAYSEHAHDAERKHERALEASCERADIAAQVLESMRRDVQRHMDESGLLEYDLGDAKQVIVVLKKENIQASDLLNRLRSDKVLSDAHIQRLNDSIRAKRPRINALESSASTSSAPFSLPILLNINSPISVGVNIIKY